MPRPPRDDLEPEILLPDVAGQQRRAAGAIDEQYRAIVYDPRNPIGREPRMYIFKDRLELRLQECRVKKDGIDEGFLSMMMYRCELAQTRESRNHNGDPIYRNGLLVCRLIRVGCRVRLTQAELATIYGRSRQFVNNQIGMLKDWCFIVNQGRGWYEFDASLCWCGDLGTCAAYREIQTVRDGITFTDGTTTLITDDMNAEDAEADCSDDDNHPPPHCVGQGERKMTENWASQGARLTADAIKTMMRYLPARYYHIKIVPNDRQNLPVITRYFTGIQLLKSVSFLRRKNAEGYHIYFRPDANHFVCVDDVCDEDIQIMIDDNVRPVLVYETSEDIHHAWVQLANRPEQVTEDEARQARVILAERYSGDKNATGKNQPGRLPGFRNVKPMHEDDKGGHPLVVIKRSCFAPVATKILKEAKKCNVRSSILSPSASFGGGVNSRNLRDACNKDDIPLEIYDRGRHVVTLSAKYEIEDLRTAYDRALNEMKSSGYVPPIRHSGLGIDRSKQDFSVACYLISNLVSEDIVIEVLMHGSDKAMERGMDYVIKTVSNVCHLIDHRTHSL